MQPDTASNQEDDDIFSTSRIDEYDIRSFITNIRSKDLMSLINVNDGLKSVFNDMLQVIVPSEVRAKIGISENYEEWDDKALEKIKKLTFMNTSMLKSVRRYEKEFLKCQHTLDYLGTLLYVPGSSTGKNRMFYGPAEVLYYAIRDAAERLTSKDESDEGTTIVSLLKMAKARSYMLAHVVELLLKYFSDHSLDTSFSTFVEKAGEPKPLEYSIMLELKKTYVKFIDSFEALIDSVVDDIHDYTNEHGVTGDSDKKYPPEGDKDDPLQRYAFSQNRKKRMPFEKDTSIERQLYLALYDHFVGNEHINKEFAELMQGFLKKGKYASLFHEPRTDMVYRGMTVPIAYLETALNKDFMSLEKEGESDKSFTFTPKEDIGVTSWTTDKRTAKRFAASPSKNYAGIVMGASVTKNTHKFIECRAGLYDVPDFNAYPNEKEVLAIGDIKVTSLKWTLSKSKK